MPIDAEKLRVLIPTTNGPVEVLLLREEDAAIGRCVACIGGTTETADIAAAYHAFVVRPTGVIESLFGHSCYRLDVSGRIDAGSSWQLGVLAAHALHAAGRLAEEHDPAAAVVWATGSVRPVDLTVGGVSHVPEKLTSSRARLEQEAAAGRRVLLAIPTPNAAELSTTLKADVSMPGIEVVELSHVRSLFDALAVKPPDGLQAIGKNAAAPRGVAASAPPRRRYIWGAAAAALLCIVPAAAYLLGQPPAVVVNPEPASPPALSERDKLVPELVPFVSALDRVKIRDVYMVAPDYKALAVSMAFMSFVTDQSSQKIANDAAMEACERLANFARARAGLAPIHACDLYASGDAVVTNRGHPPMPPPPWIIRDPSVERPFVAADVPLIRERGREQAARNYEALPKAKAFVVGPKGGAVYYSGEPSPEEAIRRGLERCGYGAGVACMVFAVDDTFVVPIPALAKVVGFYRPEALTAVAPALRDDVARRLRNATSGWSAVAIGAGGRVGLKLAAETEQVAVDAAMAACSRQDRDCRIAVIGPFLVDGDPDRRSERGTAQ